MEARAKRGGARRDRNGRLPFGPDRLPFILARVAADRQDERLATQDRLRLAAFIEGVCPVTELFVGCALGGRALEARVARDAFVHVESDRSVTAFAVWAANAWPPGANESEAFATALADLLGPGYFEAFYALVSAPSDERRYHLLRLAGASTELPVLGEDEIGEDSTPPAEPVMTPGEKNEEEPATKPSAPQGTSSIVKTLLFRPKELFIEDDPVRVIGSLGQNHPPGKNGGRGHGGGSGPSVGYGGRTDLSELDRVGMYVALTFEQRRIRREASDPADADRDGVTVDRSGGGSFCSTKANSPRSSVDRAAVL